MSIIWATLTQFMDVLMEGILLMRSCSLFSASPSSFLRRRISLPWSSMGSGEMKLEVVGGKLIDVLVLQKKTKIIKIL